MKLSIQLFGGRGASSSTNGRSRGTGSGFLGEEKGGFRGGIGETRFFAGDKVTDREGKEFTVTEATNSKIEFYSGDETRRQDNAIGYQLKERGQIGNRLLATQRVNVLRNADGRTQINGRSVAMYNKAPKGFTKTGSATTAPNGYEWYNNNKSLFGDERINILVRKRRK